MINLLLFIDFKKAFDYVNSDLLLLKLFHYGFSNTALSLMKNYFHNRFQLTKVNDNKSDLLQLLLGVPQGSVLGPLLFLIFINDLAYYMNDFYCILFADDTTLLDSNCDLDSLISSFKSKLALLLEWCSFNKLNINWTKTYIMLISKKHIDAPLYIQFNDIKIEIVQNFKLLGIYIDNNLMFDTHVKNICLSINKKLYAIKRLFQLSLQVKLQFFKSFIMPYFDYCISLLIYFPKTSIQRLANCYYACLYKLFNFKFAGLDNVTINNMLKPYNLFCFEYRFLVRSTTFIYNIVNNNNSPKILQTSLKNRNEICTK